MDLVTALVTVVSVVIAHVGALLALWLRLRWQVRHARVRGHYLVQLTQTAAGRGRLEIAEEHGRAHRLTMTLASGAGADTAV